MTRANHGTVDTCGENVSLHCDESYYSNEEEIGKDKCLGIGRLMEARSINTPAKMLKLELGMQVPVKSPFKLSRDVIKSLRKKGNCGVMSSLNTSSIVNWSDKHVDILKEYRDPGPTELSLPNSRIGFFNECVIQRFHNENPDTTKARFREPSLDDVYDFENSYANRQMELSKELITFSVGGPRFFENNAIVESFDEWKGENLTNNEF